MNSRLPPLSTSKPGHRHQTAQLQEFAQKQGWPITNEVTDMAFGIEERTGQAAVPANVRGRIEAGVRPSAVLGAGPFLARRSAPHADLPTTAGRITGWRG